jgi:hypothetical protein
MRINVAESGEEISMLEAGLHEQFGLDLPYHLQVLLKGSRGRSQVPTCCG